MDSEGHLKWYDGLSSKGIRPGLDNMRELLSRLGNPQTNLRFIHVAGTDGKGSVCAMLESVLIESGFVTGTFTSPHITRINECLRISGRDIDDRDLVQLIGCVRTHADSVGTTQFETLTAMAYLLFSAVDVDICIIESGMGGRSDATNVIIPEITIINHIGIEHSHFLGTTLKDISWEKAGIMKSGIPCITINDDESYNVLKSYSETVDCELIRVDPCDIEVLSTKPDSTSFTYGEDYFTIGIPGTIQAYNAALAIEALRRLPEYEERIKENVFYGLEVASIPCRFQKVLGKPLILDVTHTVDGMRHMAKDIDTIYGKVDLIIGLLSDKNAKGICETLSGIGTRIYVTAPGSSRAMPVKTLYGIMKEFHEDIIPCDSVEQALELALNEATGREILVTGSFRTVEDALVWIRKES